MNTIDRTELVILSERVRALEQLNQSLAEQIDRMDKVIKRAQTWHLNDKGLTRIDLHQAIDSYNGKMRRLAKEVE